MTSDPMNDAVPPVAGVVVADPAAPGGLRLLGPADVAAALAELVRRRLPGGCDDCRAEHEYTGTAADGVFDVWVHHDETCPRLRAPRV